MNKKIIDILNNIQKDILYNHYYKIYDLYKFYGIDETECLTKNYYKNGSNE